jgi:hypothetical protein
MNCNSTTAWLSKVLLATLNKPLNDIVWWYRAINKDHVLVLNAVVGECSTIILVVVQSYHFGYT